MHSPLDQTTCIARLKSGVDSPWKLFGTKDIIGEVGPLYASLRRRVRWRTPFRVCLDVSLVPRGDATTLICRRGLHPLASLMTSGWFGLLIAVIGLLSVFAVAGGLLERYWPLLALAPVLFGGVLLAFMLGRGDPAQDHDFLIEHLALMTESTAT